MGNLCSIFHARFRNLVKVINSTPKAQLVDYILLGWQTSSYKLKNSDKKWFMKPYDLIVSETGIPKSTLERYLKELDNEGFIERRQALYSKKNGQGEFEVKKGGYIYVTEKLLNLIKPVTSPEPSPPKGNGNNRNDNKNSQTDNQLSQNSSQPDCPNFDINEGFDPLKVRGLFISDLDSLSITNTISFTKSSKSVDKTTQQRLLKQYESIHQFLFTDIKEEIPDVVKKLVLGTFYNLTFQHHKELSLPQQTVAEYLFAFLNNEFYLQGITCLKHRNNILAKMLRGNNWRTPKGFYNHFYLGQNFKDKQEIRDQQLQKQKEDELKQTTYALEEDVKDERLSHIENQMNEKSSQIEVLTQSIYQEPSEEIRCQKQTKIQKLRKELEVLWRQQSQIENELENQSVLNAIQLCA
jgi:hypothetical protein